ncbi:glycosyltransferase [Mycobacterium sp. NPDC048908]|uniref:glycosyltransferase n=1 Tax=Mycobacterium sp. NPDC048908 TaxID=3364292 RepID=UPI003722F1AF
MIVLFDPKLARGGGQVVLEQLLAQLAATEDVGLVMPPRGQRAINIPEHVRTFDSVARLGHEVEPNMSLLLVANANASFPTVMAAARRFRPAHSIGTVGIVHNYPSSKFKGIATVQSLKRLDMAVAVEPGLTSLRRDAIVPSWLAPTGPLPDAGRSIRRTGRIKCYARPDRTKGLHLVPEIFREMERAGLECSVALGAGLDRQDRYAAKLRRSLAPWLEEGPRSRSWINSGDVFLIPSLSGEAACLTAQEAMAAGAWVVASRIGLMPYLAPQGEAVSTFAIGDVAGAVATLTEVARLPEKDFADACQRSQAAVAVRHGRWFDTTTALLVRLHAELAAT